MLGKREPGLLKHFVDDWRSHLLYLLGSNQRFFSPRSLGLVSYCNLWIFYFLPHSWSVRNKCALGSHVASTFVWMTGPPLTTEIVTMTTPWRKTRRHVQPLKKHEDSSPQKMLVRVKPHWHSRIRSARICRGWTPNSMTFWRSCKQMNMDKHIVK